MKTAKYDTDNIPTSCHILVVDNDGKTLQQIKIREARDYSRDYMLQKGCEHLSKMAQGKKIFKDSSLDNKTVI